MISKVASFLHPQIHRLIVSFLAWSANPAICSRAQWRGAPRYLQLINVPANCKRRKVFGKLPVKSFRSCTANRSKNSTFSRLLGQWTLSTFRLKAEPKTKLRRVSGKITLDTVSQLSKVKLWRFGQVMFSIFCRKDPPNLKHWSRSGQITLSTLRVKFAPKVKHWRCVGNLT